MPDWIAHLNSNVLSHYRTRLVGGFDEPFYRAHRDEIPAEIQFTRDYERSALHELAHWCVAGEARRRLDDYGYWYAPDGRTNDQQRAFFEVEVTPQALEKHFCMALGIAFCVSVDNLGNGAVDGIEGFAAAVNMCFDRYTRHGLPARAALISRHLSVYRHASEKNNNQPIA
ncbi:MAG: elongation factor P hydroxylase [Pseudomonadota bacterium]